MGERGESWLNMAYKKYVAEFYRDNPGGTPLNYGAWKAEMAKSGRLQELSPGAGGGG